MIEKENEIGNRGKKTRRIMEKKEEDAYVVEVDTQMKRKGKSRRGKDKAANSKYN